MCAPLEPHLHLHLGDKAGAATTILALFVIVLVGLLVYILRSDAFIQVNTAFPNHISQLAPSNVQRFYKCREDHELCI